MLNSTTRSRELSAVGLCFLCKEKHAYLCKDVVTGALLQGHWPNP